jgi:hypothetical protein
MDRRALLRRSAALAAALPILHTRAAHAEEAMATQTDILNNDGQKHLITAPFTIRSYTVVNSGALSVFILDGLGNRLDVVDPGETTSANWGGTSLTAQFAAATTGSAVIITSDTATTPTSSYTPGFGPGTVTPTVVLSANPAGPAIWLVKDTFTYAADIYEVLWWRVAVQSGSTSQGYVFTTLLQDAAGNTLDVDIAFGGPFGELTSYPARSAAHDFPAPPQLAMRPGQHLAVQIGLNNGAIGAGQAAASVAFGIRRRTFTS